MAVRVAPIPLHSRSAAALCYGHYSMRASHPGMLRKMVAWRAVLARQSPGTVVVFPCEKLQGAAVHSACLPPGMAFQPPPKWCCTGALGRTMREPPHTLVHPACSLPSGVRLWA